MPCQMLNWNYLRVRGEYVRMGIVFRFQSELPPRARRIPSCRSSGRPNRGTTSACAENTVADFRGVGGNGNYLRVRGEYPVWRWLWAIVQGTTSACAENTSVAYHHFACCRNYLRVRGEYQADANRHFVTGELPPRARRIPPPAPPKPGKQGTTSACAENTRIAQ